MSCILVTAICIYRCSCPMSVSDDRIGFDLSCVRALGSWRRHNTLEVADHSVLVADVPGYF